MEFCILLNFIWLDCLWLWSGVNLRAKFIVTAPSRISSMNLRSRLIVSPGCAWIGSLASVTVRRRLEVSVIGFLFWLLILQEMLLCLWLAPPVLISSYYLVITTFCCDLITFLFGLWLLESLARSVENEYGNGIRMNIQYSAFQNIRWKPNICCRFSSKSYENILFGFKIKFISNLDQFSRGTIVKIKL